MSLRLCIYAVPYLPDYEETWWHCSQTPEELVNSLKGDSSEFWCQIVIDQLDCWVNQFAELEFDFRFNRSIAFENEDLEVVAEAFKLGKLIAMQNDRNYVVYQNNILIEGLLFGLLSLAPKNTYHEREETILSLVRFLVEAKMRDYSFITVCSSMEY